jgi:hypothetical protein
VILGGGIVIVERHERVPSLCEVHVSACMSNGRGLRNSSNVPMRLILEASGVYIMIGTERSQVPAPGDNSRLSRLLGDNVRENSSLCESCGGACTLHTTHPFGPATIKMQTLVTFTS